jgi:hypothetical protein
MSKIYKDFNDYYSNGKHGCSSASKDWLKEIWDDLYPTITASQNDYKKAYLVLMQEESRRRCKLTDALLRYVDEAIKKHPDLEGFWKWWSLKILR